MAETLSAEENSHRDWSTPELKFLATHYPRKGAAYCAQHLNRTKSSIYSEAGRREIRRIGNGAPVGRTYTSMSAEEVAQGLGASARTVSGWIRTDGLKARLQPEGWLISRSGLRNWIATNADKINLAKVDKDWFVRLAFGRRS